MRRKLLSLLLVFALLISPMGFQSINAYGGASNVPIYVDATNGSDTLNNGTSAMPYETINKAISIAESAYSTDEVIIYLKQGNYSTTSYIRHPNLTIEAYNDGSGNYDTVTIYPDYSYSGADPYGVYTNQWIFCFNDTTSKIGLTLSHINLSGDNLATPELENGADATAIYMYSADGAGTYMTLQDCNLEDFGFGIHQAYSSYIVVSILSTYMEASSPVRMDEGASLIIEDSTLRMTSAELSDSIVNIGYNIPVSIINNDFYGNNGAGRGIYEHVSGGLIQNNRFFDLNRSIELDSFSNLVIEGNTIETTYMGMDLEPAKGGSLAVTGNAIINKGIKRNGATGLDLGIYADHASGSILITNNTIANFYIAIDCYGSSDENYSVTLGGVSLGNIFRGNVLNLYWNSYIAPPIDLQGTDWGTSSSNEVSQRIYANGLTPSSVFLLDGSFTTLAPSTLYVDDDFSPSAAGGHTFGTDAFNTITEALAYAATGADVLVNDGSYIAPTWIDRPVSIIGQGDSVELSRHPSLTAYGNVTTSITSTDVRLERLRFSNGDVGISFDPFTLYSLKTYPEAYEIIECHFTNFDHGSIRDLGYLQYEYPLLPGTVSEIRDNTFYQDSMTNGTTVYVLNQSDHLIFTGNSYQTSGPAMNVFSLNGLNTTVTGNSITLNTEYYDSNSVVSIDSASNMLCSDNQIINSYSGTKRGTGLSLYFSGSESGLKKEVYRNTLSGFNTGLFLYGVEGGDYFDITVGGIASNANDLSNNNTGLASHLNNYGNEPTNATYNIWGVPDGQLATYINQTYPVTHLPSVASRFAGGTGTESNPYQIGTPAHLDNIRLYLGEEYQDKYFQLTQDIDLGTSPWNTGEGWNPIGSYEAQFYGNFDGNGKTVSNLTINRPGASNSNIGLFGYLHSNAEITDLTLQNSTVSGHGSVGALAGRSDGSLANITATSTVTGNGNGIGGLVGTNAGTLQQASVSAVVTGNSLQTGGVVGYNFGTIQDCRVSGNVTGTSETGGLAGKNSGTISASHCTASVNGTQFLGGLVGDNLSSISNCSASGDVTLLSSGDKAGGLVGNNMGTISTSFATGDIIGDSELGGLVGVNYNSIVNSYAKGAVTGASNSVGGLVGIAANSGSTITNCYSIGSVIGGSQVGGALGANHGSVSAVFYNSNTTGQTDSDKGTPKTTAQLKTLSTYSGWSFPSIWTLNSNDNSGYPALAWQGYTHSSPSSGNSSGGGGAPAPAITIITEVNPGTTSNLVQLAPTITGDTATASVSSSVLDALLTKAQATEGTGSRDLLQISLDTPSQLSRLTISLPQRELSQITTNSDSSLAIQSPFLSVRFDHKALDVITKADQGGSVQVTATVVDPKTLSPEDQKKVEGRPVFDFTVTNGNTQVSDFKNGHATVTIPYTLEPGENPSSIIVYYLNDDGKLEVIRGHYDKNSNAVIFKTKHFSSFLIGNNPVSFADVGSNAWYKDAVTFLAARGITSGTTTDTFSPSQQLTRAQFLVLAMNGYRINPVSDIENSGIENFADAGNRYYSAYLLKAKEIGLTQGIGNNLFAPDRPITRQEMFVLLYNILEQLEEMPLPEDPNREMEFQDESSLSAWAKEPALRLYQSGIIEGSNKLLNPKGTATRAEMAQILYNLLNE